MNAAEMHDRETAVRHRQEQMQKYWAGDLSRKIYLLRRQRKAILENCRRIAVVGINPDPQSSIYVALERLLGMGLEIIPIFSDRESFLGLRCYARVRDVPGNIDIVQIHPRNPIDLLPLAHDAVQKGVHTFWMEIGLLASPEVAQALANGNVQLVEYESLEAEYLKHTQPMAPALRKDRKGAKVHERMTRSPITTISCEPIKDALAKMERGKFRHLPVLDEQGKLTAILSDRDVRLIQPSLAFVNEEDPQAQFGSMTVQEVAVFDPIKVNGETSLKEAATLMLKWQVGGLPVVDKQDRVTGMITYTDILREFIGREENR